MENQRVVDNMLGHIFKDMSHLDRKEHENKKFWVNYIKNGKTSMKIFDSKQELKIFLIKLGNLVDQDYSLGDIASWLAADKIIIDSCWIN